MPAGIFRIRGRIVFKAVAAADEPVFCFCQRIVIEQLIPDLRISARDKTGDIPDIFFICGEFRNQRCPDNHLVSVFGRQQPPDIGPDLCIRAACGLDMSFIIKDFQIRINRIKIWRGS